MIDMSQFGRITESPVKEIRPLQVLYEFEGPRIFSSSSDFGLLLCYVARDFEDSQLLVLTPTTQTKIKQLLAGHITVREALTQSWSWLASADYTGAVLEVAIPASGPPEEYLPNSDRMLYRHLQPVLSIKLEGSTITEDSVRASVARQAIDAGTLALKRVVDVIWNANSGGRPSNVLRFFSDLPAQRFAFGSFQVDFALPDSAQAQLGDKTLEQDFQRIGSELDRLLEWVNDGQEASTDLNIQELKVLERIVPPLSGQIETISISGSIFNERKPRTITRVATQKLKTAMKLHEKEQRVHSYSGRVRELDKDTLTFTLRDLRGSDESEILCRFEPSLLETINDRFNDDTYVTIFGRQVKNMFETSDLSGFDEDKAPAADGVAI